MTHIIPCFQTSWWKILRTFRRCDLDGGGSLGLDFEVSKTSCNCLPAVVLLTMMAAKPSISQARTANNRPSTLCSLREATTWFLVIPTGIVFFFAFHMEPGQSFPYQPVSPAGFGFILFEPNLLWGLQRTEEVTTSDFLPHNRQTASRQIMEEQSKFF